MSSRNNNTNKLIRNTAIYAAFAGLLGYIIFTQHIALGEVLTILPMPDQLASMDLDILLTPVLISVSIFYIASIVGLFFEGNFADVLVGTLYAAGFASFFATFLMLNPNSNIQEAGTMLTAAFSVVLLYNTLATYAKIKEKPWIKSVMISITIYLEGQIAVRLLDILINNAMQTPGSRLITALGEFINLGVTIAAIFTFFAIFYHSKNPYLGALGGIASNYLFAIALSVIGALYYGFFIGAFREIVPGIEGLAPYVQWTGICVFAALVFTIMRRGMQGSIMIKNKIGNWQKHLQQITTYKGDRFLGFTHIVDEFVNEGKKDRLLVRLALFLHENHMKDDDISATLEDLINYKDEEKPAMSREGQSSSIDKKNRDSRLDVIQRTLDTMIPSGKADFTLPEEPKMEATTSIATDR
jgi:hypothetical protein